MLTSLKFIVILCVFLSCKPSNLNENEGSKSVVDPVIPHKSEAVPLAEKVVVVKKVVSVWDDTLHNNKLTQEYVGDVLVVEADDVQSSYL